MIATCKPSKTTIWVWEEDLTASHLRSTYVTRWSEEKPTEAPHRVNIRRAEMGPQA